MEIISTPAANVGSTVLRSSVTVTQTQSPFTRCEVNRGRRLCTSNGLDPARRSTSTGLLVRCQLGLVSVLESGFGDCLKVVIATSDNVQRRRSFLLLVMVDLIRGFTNLAVSCGAR